MARSRQVFPATRRRYVFQATGGMTVAGTFYQDPSEQLPRSIQFMAAQLPVGAVLSTATVAVTDMADHSAQPGIVTSPTARVIGGLLVEATFKSAVDGHRYEAVFSIRDSLNYRYTEKLIMIGKA